MHVALKAQLCVLGTFLLLVPCLSQVLDCSLRAKSQAQKRGERDGAISAKRSWVGERCNDVAGALDMMQQTVPPSTRVSAYIMVL